MIDNLNNEKAIEMNEDKSEIQKEFDVESENQIEVKLEDKFLDVQQSEREYSTDCMTDPCYTAYTQCIETVEAPPTGGYQAEVHNEKKCILKKIFSQPFLTIIFLILTILLLCINQLTFAIFSLVCALFVICIQAIEILIIYNKPNKNTHTISIYNKLDTSKWLLDTLNKKIKVASQYNIEIQEYLEFAIKVETEIEKLRSSISIIFTEVELITNGQDVRKHCDTVDEHNKQIFAMISKLNNELADKILKQ